MNDKYGIKFQFNSFHQPILLKQKKGFQNMS